MELKFLWKSNVVDVHIPGHNIVEFVKGAVLGICVPFSMKQKTSEDINGIFI